MNPPNILVVVSDQLSQKAVGAYGDPYGATPTVDALAARGVRFGNAYCNCPLCGPSRASFWTGRLPHETGVLSNGRKFVNAPLPDDMPTLGSLFSEAGYETLHFGKRHDGGALRGFAHVEPEGELPVEPLADSLPVNYDTRRDRYTTEKVVEWLRGRGGSAGAAAALPFLLVADLQNPHDICSWIGANQGPHEDRPIPGPLPELPPNFEDADFAQRPIPVQYLCCSHNRLAQAARWSEGNYRHYLAAYYHYVRRMDGELARILAALDEEGLADDTLVVFFADHGDGMASHRMVTKQVSFYEETTRVPFVVSGPGVSCPAGTRLDGPLVSLVDLVPTLCDAAGVPTPAGLPGRSLMPHLRGEAPPPGEPEYVACEWHTEWGFTVEPGRMIRTRRFKYTRYVEGEGEELYDLEADPGETRTLARDPAHAGVLARHRELLREHAARTDDPFFTLTPYAAPRWRAHAPGYPNHEGPAAPAAEGVG